MFSSLKLSFCQPQNRFLFHTFLKIIRLSIYRSIRQVRTVPPLLFLPMNQKSREEILFYFMLKCISFRVIQQRKTKWLSCCIYTQFNTNHYINDNYYWCALHLNCNTTGGWERKTQPALYVQQRTHRKSHTGLRE